MKLATYQDGSRDGQLVVVSRDLRMAHYATHIAYRLQQVLDDWNFLSPSLQDLYERLNAGRARHAFPFDPAQCMAPLPRATQWLQWENEVLLQGAADDLQGPTAALDAVHAAHSLDFCAGLAAITADLARGCSEERALDAIRLLMLVNTPVLRELQAEEAALGQPPLRSRLAPICGPVVLTPDELAEHWIQGRVHLPLHCSVNGRRWDACDAAAGMPLHFGQILARAAQTRRLRAGAIVACAPLHTAHGACTSLADRRASELSRNQGQSDWLREGDALRIELQGQQGAPLMGAITQSVVGQSASGASP